MKNKWILRTMVSFTILLSGLLISQKAMSQMVEGNSGKKETKVEENKQERMMKFFTEVEKQSNPENKFKEYAERWAKLDHLQEEQKTEK